MNRIEPVRPQRVLLFAIDAALFALAVPFALALWHFSSTTSQPRSGWLIQLWLTRLPFYVVGQCLTVTLPGVLLMRSTARMRVGWLLDVLVVAVGERLFLMLAYLVVLACVYLPQWFGHRPLFQHSGGLLVVNYLVATVLIVAARLIGRALRGSRAPVSR